MKECNKNKILLFIKLPPPSTGATYINKIVLESKLLNSAFSIKSLKASYSRSVIELGSKSLRKTAIIIKIYLKLLKNLIIFKPDLIYFQLSPLGIAFLRDLFYVTAMKLFQKKIIFHLHGKGIAQSAKKSLFYRLLYKYCFKNTYIICLSDLIKKDISEVYEEDPYILHNCLDSDYLVHYSKDKGNKKRPTLIMISNLHESKGIFDFIEVIKLLTIKNSQVKGVLIGAEGRVKSSELLDYINRKGLKGNFEYLGSKYGKEKIKELQKADVLIHPTKNEAWGLVILEAMAMRLPVISTYEGSIPVMIKNNFNGYLVDKGDVIKMADYASALINNPTKRIELGQNGRNSFESRFTHEKFEKNLVGIFNDVLKANEPTNPAT